MSWCLFRCHHTACDKRRCGKAATDSCLREHYDHLIVDGRLKIAFALRMCCEYCIKATRYVISGQFTMGATRPKFDVDVNKGPAVNPTRVSTNSGISKQLSLTYAIMSKFRLK